MHCFQTDGAKVHRNVAEAAVCVQFTARQTAGALLVALQPVEHYPFCAELLRCDQFLQSEQQQFAVRLDYYLLFHQQERLQDRGFAGAIGARKDRQIAQGHFGAILE